MSTSEKHFLTRKQQRGWFIERFDGAVHIEEGPMSWQQCDGRSRVLIQAGYDKVRG